MAGAPTNPIQRFLRRMAAGGAGEDPDRLLLERFVGAADQAAFEALVRRHGPLVLNVCTRVLDGVHDAEDAFQATFLVLVRKAGSLRAPESLGPWLYGVAYRTALKARAQAARRRRREQPLVDVAGPAAIDGTTWREVRAILDEEVHRLPPRYRVPFVLCYLQGKTNAEAARLLGCAQGTVFSRLAWAREQLRKRLDRRGLAVGAAALATLLTASAAGAALPVAQVLSTSRAALEFAAGSATAAGMSPTPVVALAEGVLRAMFLTKLKVAAVVLVALATAGAVAGVLTHYALAGQPDRAGIAAAGEPRATKDDLRGTWVPVEVTEDGKEIPEAEIKAKNFEMVITAEKVTLPIRDEVNEVDYKLDPAKKPKQIDLLFRDGRTAKGIYALAETTLKLCVGKFDVERPTEFAAPEGTNHILMVLKKKS
jgi:RNA polymerase sigma factor (sigma-70 family)